MNNTTTKQPGGIKLIEGFHITPTEKKSIEAMLKAGLVSVRNRPDTKRYTIIQGWPVKNGWEYKIRIGTKSVWAIGDVAKW